MAQTKGSTDGERGKGRGREGGREREPVYEDLMGKEEEEEEEEEEEGLVKAKAMRLFKANAEKDAPSHP
jgi:hypothetical protein